MLKSILKIAGRIAIGTAAVLGVRQVIKEVEYFGELVGAAKTLNDLRNLEKCRQGLSSYYVYLIDFDKRNPSSDFTPTVIDGYRREGSDHGFSHTIRRMIEKRFYEFSLKDFEEHPDILHDNAVHQHALVSYLADANTYTELYKLSFAIKPKINLNIIYQIACDCNLIIAANDTTNLYVTGLKEDVNKFTSEFWASYNLLAMERGCE